MNIPKKFSQRSYEPELLDAPDIPAKLLHRNLKELDLINRVLGGTSITITGIKQLLTDKNKVYHIADLGCGGGDAMIAVAEWARRSGYQIRLTGVDVNVDCIQYMLKMCKDYPEISGVASDYRIFLQNNHDVDIVHCSLFCHHLKDEELIELFANLQRSARCGFVINDLQRHWFAYHSIKILTRLFNGSTLVKNDAPLSVLRGFSEAELEKLLNKAGVKDYQLDWKWAFRYLIVGKPSYG